MLSPVAIRILPRTALKEVKLSDGTVIHAGETVLVRVFEANRDPSIHDHPDVFDISRAHPNKHLTFGNGIHLCNGNQLGRLQIKRLIQTILLDGKESPLRRLIFFLSPCPVLPNGFFVIVMVLSSPDFPDLNFPLLVLL